MGNLALYAGDSERDGNFVKMKLHSLYSRLAFIEGVIKVFLPTTENMGSCVPFSSVYFTAITFQGWKHFP